MTYGTRIFISLVKKKPIKTTKIMYKYFTNSIFISAQSAMS